MGSSEIISVLALLIAIGGYYETRRSNNIQLRQAVALEESNRIAVGSGGGSAMVTPLHSIPSTPLQPKSSRWSILALGALLLMNLGVTAVNRWGWMLKSDPRYLGLSAESDSADLSESLAKVTDGEIVLIGCFLESSRSWNPDSTDRLSCDIAVKYRDIMANAGWTPPSIAPQRYSEGLSIATAPNSPAPARATALLRELSKKGMHVGWINISQLKPGQFALIVGLNNNDLIGQ